MQQLYCAPGITSRNILWNFLTFHYKYWKILYLKFKLSNEKAQFVPREHGIIAILRHHLASQRSFSQCSEGLQMLGCIYRSFSWWKNHVCCRLVESWCS
jgi:hypothetical protein